MAKNFYKQESRKDWFSTLPEGQGLSIEHLQLGAILRIADATELMATRWREIEEQNVSLKETVDRYQGMYSGEAAAHRTAKGHLTRLRKEIKQLKEDIIRLENLKATSDKLLNS